MIELGTQVALVVALVALVRKYVPKVDGWIVLVLGVACTGLVVFASMVPASMWMRALQVLVGALGGTAFVGQLADRHAEAVGNAVASGNSIAPPAITDAEMTPVIIPANEPPKGAA